MKNYLSKNKFGFLLFIFTIILAVIVLFTALRLYQLKNSPITLVAPGDSQASTDNIISCQLLVMNLAIASPSPSPSASPTASASPQPPVCVIYAIHDASAADTQFITIDPKTSTVSKLGPLYPGYNAESLEYDSQTGNIYSVVRGGSLRGKLVTVHPTTGALTPVGDTGTNNILALAINNTDHSLWGWEDGKGLVIINKATGQKTLKLSSNLDIGGFAWDNNGEFAYGSSRTNSNLYRYTLSSNTISLFSSNLPGTKNEALEMNSDNILLGGFHGASNEISIYAYDINTKSLLLSGNIPTPYNDIEGIAWPDNCGEIPPIETDPIISQCVDIKYYDKQFNSLSVEDLAKLSKGDTIRMTVSGSSTDGNIDKARFKINGTVQTEVTTKKPSSDEFYFDYVIPANMTELKVNAEIHHNSLGWF